MTLTDMWRDMTTTALHGDDFRQWLANKQPDTIVGHGASVKACPVGNFLFDKVGVLPFVTNHTVMWHADGHGWIEIVQPDEFASFVIRIDSVAANGAAVTASTALQIWDEVANAE